MPRNRYTKRVRISEHAQFTHQEKQLVHLTYQLRCGITESPETPPVFGPKDRRSARLAQKRRHKPVRARQTAETTPTHEGGTA